jgi:hypothetical protein
MRRFIIDETYIIKGQHRPYNINERMENVTLSLAIVENEYRTRHGEGFQTWLTGGTSGHRAGDYRLRYLDALTLPIDGYKRVHGLNKCNDLYYQNKLDRGLIVPFTEKQLKKRSFSLKAPNRDNEGDGKPFYFFQSKGDATRETNWFDLLSNGGTTERGGRKVVSFGDTPENHLIAKEEQEAVHSRLTGAGFTPDEIFALTHYLESEADFEGKRGAKKLICEELDITRDKLNWLLKRLDKFLAKCG